MKKKFFTVGMAAFLGASLAFLGCDGPTDGSAEVPGWPSDALIMGASVEGLQKMIDRLDGTPAELILDGVTLTNVGTINFKSVNAFIVGDFATAGSGGTVINAAYANVTFAPGANIDAQSTDVIIGDKATFTAYTVTGSPIMPEFKTDFSGGPIGTDVFFMDLNVNSGNWAEFKAFAGNSKTVYVVRTLRLDVSSGPVDTEDVKLVTLVATEAKGTNGAGLTLGSNAEIGTLKATGTLKITSVGTGGVAKLDLNGQALEVAAVTNIAEITNCGKMAGSLALPDGDVSIAKLSTIFQDINVTSTWTTRLTASEFSTTGPTKLSPPSSVVAFTATGGGGYHTPQCPIHLRFQAQLG
jgi:hypothetical protein